MKYLIIVFTIASFVLSGCAGGGGSTHVPPEKIVAGEPIELRIELTTWGAGSGNIDSRYTRIRCHYRDALKSEFQVADAKIASASKSRMMAVVTIDPETVLGAEEIEYYFDFLFDGVPNRRDGAVLKLQRKWDVKTGPDHLFDLKIKHQ